MQSMNSSLIASYFEIKKQKLISTLIMWKSDQCFDICLGRE